MKRRASSSGTIVARKNGFMPRYYVIDTTGKRKDCYGTIHQTKKDAREELTALLHSLNAGTHVDKSAQTVGQWLREWLELWTPKAGPKTKERYRESVEWYVIPRIGNTPLQDLDSGDVQRLYRELHATGRRRPWPGQSPGLQTKTIATLHGVLKRAMSKAVALKKIRGNPCEGVELPAADANVRSTYNDGTVDIHDCLSQEQLTRLLDSFKGHPLRPLVVLAAASGMRRGELLALQWNAVDLDKKTLHVQQTLEVTGKRNTRELRVKPPKTKSSIRNIDLPESVVAVLRAHWAQQAKDALAVGVTAPKRGLVFPHRPWEPLRHQDPGIISARFAALAKVRGFKVHLHQLRHTHASLLLRAGVPITDVAMRLGHANPSITLRVYSHAITSDQAHTVAAVDRMLSG